MIEEATGRDRPLVEMNSGDSYTRDLDAWGPSHAGD
jgi:hypothetical protein